MKKWIIVILVLIMSYLLGYYVYNEGWGRLANYIQDTLGLYWYQVNDLYFIVSAVIYTTVLLFYQSFNNKQKMILRVVVPLTAILSFLMMHYGHGLDRHFQSMIMYSKDFLSVISLYFASILVLLYGSKVLKNKNKFAHVLPLIIGNTLILYCLYISLYDFLQSGTV